MPNSISMQCCWSKYTLNRAVLAGQGYVVIGSDDGQIRMYSEKSLTRANTAIPGLGGPITAVDVTYDGKWVLATTKNYLMVVKTTYKVCLASAMLPSHEFEHLLQTIYMSCMQFSLTCCNLIVYMAMLDSLELESCQGSPYIIDKWTR